MVELEIGSTKQKFTAHVSVLSQSPLLRQQIPPSRVLGPIQILNNSPRTFGFVLEYLYTHRVEFDRWESGEDLPMDLAFLYIEACVFGLESLRQIVISKLKALPALKDDATLLLELAEEMYTQIPKTDKLFKGFFIAALDKCRNGPSKFPKDYADRLVAQGGELAIDICKAERRRSSVLTAKEASMRTRCYLCIR